MQDARKSLLVAACLVAIILAAATYADMVYVAPTAPPQMIYTIKGPVVLYEDAQAGDIITAPNLGTLYYLNQDRKCVVFPDEQTFLSWYPDFSGVKTVTQEKLESFPLSGRNATIRPGTLMVKIQSAPFVYLIGFQKTLYSLKSEEQAVELFGADWSSRVVDIPEYYFVNYDYGIELSGIESLPAGFVYRATSNQQVYLITPEGQRLIDEAGLLANHIADRFILTFEQPLDLPLAGPTISTPEPRWSSPDTVEQAQDQGPKDLETAGYQTEAG